MRTVAELERLLTEYRQHECSDDEWERGCPVCNDIDGLEHELRMASTAETVMQAEVKKQEELETLREQNEVLRKAVRNQAGDNLCWLTGQEPQIPPVDEFLESCRRYHQQISESRGVLNGCMTIAQLESELERLREFEIEHRRGNAGQVPFTEPETRS